MVLRSFSAVGGFAFGEEFVSARFKDPIFRFDSLVRDTNKKINEKEIKEAVNKYKELREGYIELAKKAGMVRRRILYGKVLRVHKKLERLLKAKPSKSFWKSKKLKKG